MTTNIARTDLKIFKPESLGSSDEAGGQRTRNAVISGQLNELFRPISEIDHALSAIDIVKFYPGLDTPGTETLLDGHIFLSEPHEDPLVSTLLMESPDINDESRMSDIRAVIESGITAGSLVREGMPGFLKGQNSFSKDYLVNVRSINGYEYRVYTRLAIGQVIAITVEYEGNESRQWPRRVHYAQVTDNDASGNSSGNIVFDPALPWPTPEPDTLINSDRNCTRLRLVNDSPNSIKWHGVTTLTEATDSQQLKVGSTVQNLIPSLMAEQSHSGLSLNADGSSLNRTMVSMQASASQTYVFNVSDRLTGNLWSVEYTPAVTYYSAGIQYSDGAFNLTASEISVTLPRPLDAGSIIAVTYLSSDRYSNYDSNETYPDDKLVVRGTIIGVGGVSLEEREDGIYRYSSSGSSTGQWIKVGVMDYTTGQLAYDPDYNGSPIAYKALLTTPESDTQLVFLLPFQQPVINSLYIQANTVAGGLVTASADAVGTISGSGVSGTVSSGVVTLNFTNAVRSSTLRYDIVELVERRPPAELYNLNPLRLPNGGKVNVFREWGAIAIEHTQYQAISSPSSGQQITIRAGANFVDITDSLGASLWTRTDDHFVVNKEAGTITLQSDFGGFTGPFMVRDTLSELALVTGVTEDALSISAPLSRQYPVGATVSSVQVLGDMQARAVDVRDLAAWVDFDTEGEPASANLNVVDFPIELSNQSCINEDWAMVFTTATSFRFIGRSVGQIATGDTLNDFAPLNPMTNTPYLTIRTGAFGSGWQAGEVVRFKTLSAAPPAVAIRSTQSGHSSVEQDKVVIALRGNEA